MITFTLEFNWSSTISLCVCVCVCVCVYLTQSFFPKKCMTLQQQSLTREQNCTTSSLLVKNIINITSIIIIIIILPFNFVVIDFL